mmetsp:Transcript_16683/g.52366  ORF Transcript_16683/g.52366 Transcript_16683/m.52366 type:complete len:242 (-) Transcript_16683:232-957(-)
MQQAHAASHDRQPLPRRLARACHPPVGYAAWLPAAEMPWAVALHGPQGSRPRCDGTPLPAPVPAPRPITLGPSRAVTLAMSFPGLETLRLSNLRSCHDGALQALGRGCPDLRSVDLQDARLISDAGVRALMDECAGIERVALEFVGVSDRLMLALARDATVAPRLQILDVLGTFAEASVDGPPLEEPVSAEGVRRLASVRPELKLRWRAGGTAEDAIKGGAAGHYATSHWPIPQEEISDRW